MEFLRYALIGIAALGGTYVLFILALCAVGATLAAVDERRNAAAVDAMIAGAIAKAEAT